MSSHRFSDLEGLRIAVEMERRGVEFYRRASRLTKSAQVDALLVELAAEEEQHQRDFERLLARHCNCRQDREPACYSAETSAYLSAIAADVVFSGGLMQVERLGGFDSLAAILTTAIDSEKNSILFYTELRDLTDDSNAREVFSHIISQEKLHLAKLQQQLIT
jgi:rubrerythrin